MNDIVVRQFSPDDLEPDLVRQVTPIARKWEAAALRVAAHHANPTKFAMPSAPDSPETILSARFGQIAKRRPETAHRVSLNAAERLALPKAHRKLGEVLNLDFARPDSVDDLATAPTPALTKADALRLVDRRYTQLGLRRAASAAAPSRQVRLDLVRVVCIDETNGLFGSEAGEDEISMSGVTLDQGGKAGQIKLFEVSSSFDDGDRVDFSPPRRLATFTDGGGDSYPRHYFATLMMFETDQGDLDETMEKIFRKFADEVAAKVTAWLGGTVGSALGPLGTAAGALIGWLVGWLMGKIVNRLIAVWEDDPFIPRTLETIIPSPTARLSQPSQVFHFRGPGEYAVRYQWSLT